MKLRNLLKIAVVLSVCGLLLASCKKDNPSPDNPSGTQNPSGGTQNPSGGNDNPSGGNDNPSGGNDNPSGGNDNPSGGNDNPSGGNDNPSGGNDNPSGGNDNPSGGNDVDETFTITFDANGAQGNAPKEMKVVSGQKATLPSGDVLSLVDYIFDGWKDADGKTLKAGDSYTMPKKDVTFSAVWKFNPSLSFNGNGYEGKMPADLRLGNGAVTIPTGKYEREGFQYVGWSTNRDARVAEYVGGESFSSPDKSVVLYAVWKAEKYEYKFHYNYNKPAQTTIVPFSAKDIANGKAKFGSAVMFYGCPADMILVGWKEVKSGVEYSVNDLFPILGNLEFQPVLAPKTSADKTEQWNIKKY